MGTPSHLEIHLMGSVPLISPICVCDLVYYTFAFAEYIEAIFFHRAAFFRQKFDVTPWN